MSPWDDVFATIAAEAADPEPILYTQGGILQPPMSAIRTEAPAPDFSGAGRTLRSITYEIQWSDLPVRPVNSDSFVHRGRRWRVVDVTSRDDVGAWQVIVTDAGAAS